MRSEEGDVAPVTEATVDLLTEGKSEGRSSASRPQLTKESESAHRGGTPVLLGREQHLPQ